MVKNKLIIILAMLIVLTACSGIYETVVVPAQFSANIISPLQNEKITNNSITFLTELNGFSFDKSTATFQLDDNTEVKMTALKYSIGNIPFGKHKITLTAKRSDGQTIVKSVDFEITAKTAVVQQTSYTAQQPVQQQTSEPVIEGGPSFGIISPTPGRIATLNAVSVSLQPINLEIAEAGAHVPGQGHFRYTLDNNAPFDVFKKTYVIRDLSEGEHTLKIALVTNDGRPYNKEAVVTFTYEKLNSSNYL